MRLARNGRSIGIRSCMALARGREILADASRTTEENLQCNQHHKENFCSPLLNSCDRGKAFACGFLPQRCLKRERLFPQELIAAHIAASVCRILEGWLEPKGRFPSSPLS